MNSKVSERNISFDILRILAAFSVVMLHSAAQTWYTLPIDSSAWFITNAYDALFRFGVPIFVMISGALFLSKPGPINIRKLYSHNILRLFLLYVIWSSVYGFIDCCKEGITGKSLGTILKTMLIGKYHLWFLPMIIGIYILVPLLHRLVKSMSDDEMRYFISLFLLLQIGRSTIRCFFMAPEVIKNLDAFQPDMICSYVGYFVLGYYFYHNDISPRLRKYLYLSIPVCCIANILFSYVFSQMWQKPNGDIYDSYGVMTFLIVIALFQYFMHTFDKSVLSPNLVNIVSELSADTLGIYVLHIAIMESSLGFITSIKALPALIEVPLLAVVCFILSAVLAALIRRIPIVGKYLA